MGQEQQERRFSDGDRALLNRVLWDRFAENLPDNHCDAVLTLLADLRRRAAHVVCAEAETCELVCRAKAVLALPLVEP